jgi:hypothetical protein
LDEEKIHITPAALRADALFSLSLEGLPASRYKKAVIDQVIFVHLDAIPHAS